MHHFSKSQDITLLLLRLLLGAVFIFAGYMKWSMWETVPEGMTQNMLYLTRFLSIVEPLGGLALILGFLTRYAAAGLAVIMTGSLYFAYVVFKVSFFTGLAGTGIDYNVLLLVGSLVLLAFGPGKWSFDALWLAKRS